MKKNIKRLFDYLKKDSMLKGFSVLFSGTIITQIVSLVLSPLLTRVYSPEQYGINSLYISVVSILGVVATLRLQVPIAMSDINKDRSILSSISLFCSFIFSILFAIIIGVGHNFLPLYFNYNFDQWVWFLPISMFLIGTYDVMYQNLLSEKKYRAMANVVILKVLCQGVSQLFFSFLSVEEYGLILGNIFSYVFSLMYIYIVLKPKFHLFSMQEYKRTLKKNINYPIYAFPAELASMASYSIIPISISFLFNTQVTGYYALANKLIGIPVGLFGNSMRQVFVREASNEFNETNTVKKTFYKTTSVLLATAVPSALLLFIGAPYFISLVFGPEWYPTATYLRILILFFIARFVIGPLTSTVNIIGKQKVGLYSHIILLVAIILLTVYFEFTANTKELHFLFLFSIIYSVVYSGFYFYMLKKIKQ